MEAAHEQFAAHPRAERLRRQDRPGRWLASPASCLKAARSADNRQEASSCITSTKKGKNRNFAASTVSQQALTSSKEVKFVINSQMVGGSMTNERDVATFGAGCF